MKVQTWWCGPSICKSLPEQLLSDFLQEPPGRNRIRESGEAFRQKTGWSSRSGVCSPRWERYRHREIDLECIPPLCAAWLPDHLFPTTKDHHPTTPYQRNGSSPPECRSR